MPVVRPWLSQAGRPVSEVLQHQVPRVPPQEPVLCAEVGPEAAGDGVSDDCFIRYVWLDECGTINQECYSRADVFKPPAYNLVGAIREQLGMDVTTRNTLQRSSSPAGSRVLEQGCNDTQVDKAGVTTWKTST